jgi:hypothetical protein
VAIELLGGPFTETALLQYAYAWERAATLRRPPFSTPPLVNGQAPAPVSFTAVAGSAGDATYATAKLIYHPTTGVLAYDVVVTGTERVLGVALHRPEGDRPGPIVAHLVPRGERAARGQLTLRGRDREDFVAGRTSLRLYSDRVPLGTTPARLTLP